MNRSRITVLSTLVLGAAIGAGIYAARPRPKPETAPRESVMDTPVWDFALHDLRKDVREGDPEDAALVRLSQFRGRKNLVLFFLCAKCRVTARYATRVDRLLLQLAQKDVAFVGVRCTPADSREEILRFADACGFHMPILDDQHYHLAIYFRAGKTPTFVVIDKQGVQRYCGGFDNSADERKVHARYLSDAIHAVLAGKPVKVKRSPALGCYFYALRR